MNTADTGGARSPLDKPLSELTEDDIAQLTREDCRRFLKQKGMRRPSWNKSQAIQQVISLKALLEDRPDSALRKNHSPPVTSPEDLIPSHRAAEDPSPYRRRDPNPNSILPPAILTCAAAAAAAAAAEEPQFPSPSPRVEPAQLTVFYGGRVRAYNEVPVEKARAILQLAASGRMDLNEPPPESVHASRTVHPAGVGPPEWACPRESEDHHGECPTDRQASLQRYREKRKDRFKGNKIIGGPPSSMEMMFLSHKFGGRTPNEQSSQSNTSSPTQPMPPYTPTRCSSIENQAQTFRISIDLNEDGGGD